MDAVSTGIPGLDEVMCGGLRPRALHMVLGAPGTGKTMLSQQISYFHAHRGHTVLYLTALSETVEGLVDHLKGLSFYDPSLIAKRLYYLSLYPELEAGGLPRVMEEIRRLVREYRAEIVVLDGLSTLKYSTADNLQFRRFVFDLNAQLSSLGATSLVVSSADSLDEAQPESYVADAIIFLRQWEQGGRVVRELEVPKLRGTAQVIGSHSFVITSDGITLYPRLESTTWNRGLPEPQQVVGRVQTNVAGLDRLMGGGLPTGSVTALVGSVGTGKTVIGLSFLADGALRGEPGVYLGFQERPQRLIEKATRMGLNVAQSVQSGRISILWDPLIEPLPDALAMRLIAEIRRIGAKRVVIDSFSDIEGALLNRERVHGFVRAITHTLRGLGTTSILTATSEGVELLDGYNCNPLCQVADNLIRLRQVHIGGRSKRLITVMKMRDSDYDGTAHEFTVSTRGVELGRPSDVGDGGLGPGVAPRVRAPK